jgi:hypothetical protein
MQSLDILRVFQTHSRTTNKVVHLTVNGDTPHSFKYINVSTTLFYFLGFQAFNVPHEALHTHA